MFSGRMLEEVYKSPGGTEGLYPTTAHHPPDSSPLHWSLLCHILVLPFTLLAELTLIPGASRRCFSLEP